MITHDDIGSDEDLAREVLIVGRDIAPCIASFQDDTEEIKNAIAVLRRVYRDIAGSGRGSRSVKSQGVGSSNVSYTDIDSAFDGQPRRALRALCSSAPVMGLSRGSFPVDRPIARIWPERY